MTQSVIAPLGGYNFALPVKHLGWTHNLILMQQVKDTHTRYGIWCKAANKAYQS